MIKKIDKNQAKAIIGGRNTNHVEKIEDSAIEDKSIVDKNLSQSGMIDLPVNYDKDSGIKLDKIDKESNFEAISEFVITKRHLPHWQIPGCIYFITYRTNKLILSDYSKDIISKSIHFHNGKKFKLYSYVIMPDHLHILLQPIEKSIAKYYGLPEINHSIKSYSSSKINQFECKLNRAVWQHESFDRIIRNEQEFFEKLMYILNNPVKKGLIQNGFEYKWYYLANLH